MKTHFKYLVLIILIVFTNIGFTQSIYKIQTNDTIDMKLKGTSTMHDWEMDAITATGEARFTFKTTDEKELTSLKSLTFNLIVKDLKSDSKELDKNAYKALKTNEFKDIYYTLSTSTLSPQKESYLFKTNGKLTVAGVTKDIAMDMHVVVSSNNTIICKGSYKLKMSDYGVEPPSFMMGIMKTGDDTTLDFTVTYIN
ncbi:YceI family protein [Aquimarina muelleri]|uniref:Lipid/polyisoprenoid-binding YceI-like domain-containing protein n=1 Tax=Aquimarina muelleri TaxID=279356 RepID=A0A918JTQ2_9FLAO|nr:YceI family protein [Aquimarina muelleri]MCX2763922.1 YceI family protein [Aquimarina muelleri]GGX11137.1 hypothetical protein GCM10007384_11150 [Aquimarina muelleri]